MNETEYLKLKQPEETDFFDIGHQNQNMELLDAELKKQNEAITGKAAKTHTHDLNGMINTLPTGESVPIDSTYLITQYPNDKNNNTYTRRPISVLWSYIKAKADKVYAALGHKHSRTEITDFPEIEKSQGQNLIPYPYYRADSYTSNGITFTVNEDGSVTANGTATATAYYGFCHEKPLGLKIGETYTLSAEVENGTASVFLANVAAKNTDIAWVRNLKNSKGSMIFNYEQVDGYKYDSLAIYITTGTILSNCNIKAQLEKGTVAHAYQPATQSNVNLRDAVDNRIDYDTEKAGATNNLIPYPYKETTKTENGITWTDNGDGTVTANGTATADSVFVLTTFSVPAGTYTVSGSPKITDCVVQLSATNNWAMASREGVAKTITYTVANKFTYCRCLISKGVTVNNAVFKPQLERGKIVHDYSPYEETHAPIEKLENNVKKSNITSSAAVTESGKYVLDAREKNASISGTLASELRQIPKDWQRTFTGINDKTIHKAYYTNYWSEMSVIITKGNYVNTHTIPIPAITVPGIFYLPDYTGDNHVRIAVSTSTGGTIEFSASSTDITYSVLYKQNNAEYTS